MEIEDAAVEYDQDPFGQVSYGYIRVTGHVLLNQSVGGIQSAELGKITLNYPKESPTMVDCILIGERTMCDETTNQYFLLVAISSRDSNVYERHGVTHRSSKTNFTEWPIQTFTII